MILTVIIGNDAPLTHMQEPVWHRSVHIELTPEQIQKIGLRTTGWDRGKETKEYVSMCFFEPGDDA